MPANIRKKQKNEVAQLLRLISVAVVLFLLYFGREILIPITLSVILSFLIAPAVRWLRHHGMNSAMAVMLAVSVFTAAIGFSGVVLGTQVVRLATSLPQYESTIREKLRALNELTSQRLSSVTGKADSVLHQFTRSTTEVDPAPQEIQLPTGAVKPIPVEVHEPSPTPVQVLSRILGSVTGPIETTGLVLVMLIFVLLEHELLRDRLIRLIGNDNLRATTVAVNDAGARLSRFFISQFIVNGAVGLLIGLALALAGVPQALLWGAMTALLRFIPYIGVWIAAALATLLASAISPGWELALTTVIIFVVVEVVVSQAVEPQLYGHTTGLSPLSVVVAAVFWNWLWGPVGLVLSTPLTLCLVVAGRYMPSLNFLEILLGEVTTLTMPEKFYQRALSGDSDDLIETARNYIKRHSVADYCDKVLIPALHLAQMDFAERAITNDERIKVSSAIAAVLISLEGLPHWWCRPRKVSVLEGETLARHLIHQREEMHGRYQGPINVAPGSVVLVVAVAGQVDELAAEVLVRVLRAIKIDARHITLQDVYTPPEDVTTDSIAAFCLVSVEDDQGHQRLRQVAEGVAARIGERPLFALCVPNIYEGPPRALPGPWPDVSVRMVASYAEAARAVQSGLEAKP